MQNNRNACYVISRFSFFLRLFSIRKKYFEIHTMKHFILSTLQEEAPPMGGIAASNVSVADF